MNNYELIEEMRYILYKVISENDDEKILLISQLLDNLIVDYYKDMNIKISA